MATAFDGHTVHMLAPDEVMHQNSLQVLYAERQVYSRTQNFSLAKEMVAAHPDIKTGPRYTISQPGKIS
jgi:hypothetical protein